jgi:hypothetical protein
VPYKTLGGCLISAQPAVFTSPLALRKKVTKRATLKIQKIPKLKIIFRDIPSKTPFPKIALRKKVTKRATPPV